MMRRSRKYVQQTCAEVENEAHAVIMRSKHAQKPKIRLHIENEVHAVNMRTAQQTCAEARMCPHADKHVKKELLTATKM